jgi:hypothetical protein
MYLDVNILETHQMQEEGTKLQTSFFVPQPATTERLLHRVIRQQQQQQQQQRQQQR